MGTFKLISPLPEKTSNLSKKRNQDWGRLTKQAAHTVSAEALAIALGSNNIGTMDGAVRVMNKTDAVYYGADTSEQVNKLPISNKAKKIAGQEMKVLKWEKEKGMHVVTAQFKKKKYKIILILFTPF